VPVNDPVSGEVTDVPMTLQVREKTGNATSARVETGRVFQAEGPSKKQEAPTDMRPREKKQPAAAQRRGRQTCRCGISTGLERIGRATVPLPHVLLMSSLIVCEGQHLD